MPKKIRNLTVYSKNKRLQEKYGMLNFGIIKDIVTV